MKAISRSSVVIFIDVHELDDRNIRNGPKVNDDDPNTRVMTKNSSAVRDKAENIFSVRTRFEIILAKFVPY